MSEKKVRIALEPGVYTGKDFSSASNSVAASPLHTGGARTSIASTFERPPTEILLGDLLDKEGKESKAFAPHLASTQRFLLMRQLLRSSVRGGGDDKATAGSTAKDGGVPDIPVAWEGPQPQFVFPSKVREQQLATENNKARYAGAAPGSEKENEIRRSEEITTYATRAAVAERALKRLQEEVDALKHKEIQHRRQRDELKALNKKLREEVVSMGTVLMDQTQALQTLSKEMDRQNPHRLVQAAREKRNSVEAMQTEKDALEKSKQTLEEEVLRLKKDLEASQHASHSVAPPTIALEEDIERAERWRVQNAELLELVQDLSSTAADEGCAQQLSLHVLSAQVDHMPTGAPPGSSKSSVHPYVIVKGPYDDSHELLRTTAPSAPSATARFDGHQRNNAAHWMTLPRTCGSLTILLCDAVTSATIGTATLAVNALLAACHRAQDLPAREGPFASLYTVPVHAPGTADDTGSVCLEVSLRRREATREKTGGQGVSAKSAWRGAHREDAAAVGDRCSYGGSKEFFTQVLSAGSLLNRTVGVPSSPYVIVSDVAGDRSSTTSTTTTTILRTPVVPQNSQRPTWDRAYAVHHLCDSKGELVFQVYDAVGDSGGVEEDDFLGEVRLSKASLLRDTARGSTPFTVPLAPREGETLSYLREFEGKLGTLTLRVCSFASGGKRTPPARSPSQSASADEPPVRPPLAPHLEKAEEPQPESAPLPSPPKPPAEVPAKQIPSPPPPPAAKVAAPDLPVLVPESRRPPLVAVPPPAPSLPTDAAPPPPPPPLLPEKEPPTSVSTARPANPPPLNTIAVPQLLSSLDNTTSLLASSTLHDSVAEPLKNNSFVVAPPICAVPPPPPPTVTTPRQDTTGEVPQASDAAKEIEAGIPLRVYVKELRNLSLPEELEDVESLMDMSEGCGPFVRVYVGAVERFALPPAASASHPVWSVEQGETVLHVEKDVALTFEVVVGRNVVGKATVSYNEAMETQGELRLGLAHEGEGCGRIFLELGGGA